MNVLPSEWTSELKNIVSSFDDTQIDTIDENTAISVVFDNTINTKKIMEQLSEEAVKKTHLEYNFDSDTVVFKYLTDSVRTELIEPKVVTQIFSEDIPAVRGIKPDFEITEHKVLVSDDSEDLRDILSKKLGPNCGIFNINEDAEFPIEYGHIIPEEDFVGDGLGTARIIDVCSSLEFECPECEDEILETKMKENMKYWFCPDCGYLSEIDASTIANLSGELSRDKIKEKVVSSI